MHIYRTLYICILSSKIQFQFTRVAVAAELIFYVKWFLRKRYCKTWLKPIWIRVPTSYSQLRLDLLHNHRIRRVFFFQKVLSFSMVSIQEVSNQERVMMAHVLYVLWCWHSICHQFFTFIQISSGHTVRETSKWKERKNIWQTLNARLQLCSSVSYVTCSVVVDCV